MAHIGDILTGAGDFLENDGKKAGDVMEKLTERRIKSEEEAENTAASSDSMDMSAPNLQRRGI